MGLFSLYVKLPFGNMVRPWCVCDLRKPWSWVRGQRVERQSIDTDHNNLSRSLSMTLLEMIRWNAVLEKRRQKEQGKPRATA